MSNLETFLTVYADSLRDCRSKDNSKYVWSIEELPLVTERMQAAIKRGSYSHDGAAFRETCKRLGIKYTRKAIEAYIGRGV